MTRQSGWHISSYSGVNDNCVEVKVMDASLPGVVRARDSKDISLPEVRVPAAAWGAFVAYVGSAQA
ncbi:DUF397 domain-containing protein [Streptomyces bacillaris]|uniref:DUF397 domain-containing protein n=1 Tax=Streptomyces TaxID=1883 RepID=UPI00081B464E|nr:MULTISPECIES: DUF397 domain-containing protein [Streptomyces]NUV44120.1 DUF397 domain-containing protein [Streptomyces sp. CAI-24]WAE69670.1 DUF397 domain-containing protein [Streptomyces cavourensis]SCE02950.1 protein of unknown function [Streptomyces sp. DvalAA-19]